MNLSNFCIFYSFCHISMWLSVLITTESHLTLKGQRWQENWPHLHLKSTLSQIKTLAFVGDLQGKREQFGQEMKASQRKRHFLTFWKTMSFCSVSRNCILSFQGVDDKKMREEEQCQWEDKKCVSVVMEYLYNSYVDMHWNYYNYLRIIVLPLRLHRMLLQVSQLTWNGLLNRWLGMQYVYVFIWLWLFGITTITSSPWGRNIHLQSTGGCWGVLNVGWKAQLIQSAHICHCCLLSYN